MIIFHWKSFFLLLQLKSLHTASSVHIFLSWSFLLQMMIDAKPIGERLLYMVCLLPQVLACVRQGAADNQPHHCCSMFIFLSWKSSSSLCCHKYHSINTINTDLPIRPRRRILASLSCSAIRMLLSVKVWQKKLSDFEERARICWDDNTFIIILSAIRMLLFVKV